jgi:hypothetical protein
MEMWVGNHRSHGIVIVGVSCVAGKFQIINVEFSTPTTYWKIGTPPLFYQVVSDSSLIGFPFRSVHCLESTKIATKKFRSPVLSTLVPAISLTDSFY